MSLSAVVTPRACSLCVTLKTWEWPGDEASYVRMLKLLRLLSEVLYDDLS